MKPKKSTYTVEEAKGRMEHYCAYQDRCHKEVEHKLSEYGMIQEARDHIILHLIQNDYLNEERFSRSYARGKFKMSKWGIIRIKRELQMKDISPINIKNGLSEIDENEYEEVLLKLAQNKYESTRETHRFKKRKKVADFLLRKGFESQKVYALLVELENQNED